MIFLSNKECNKDSHHGQWCIYKRPIYRKIGHCEVCLPKTAVLLKMGSIDWHQSANCLLLVYDNKSKEVESKHREVLQQSKYVIIFLV